MKNYLPKITLNENERGCFILDTIKGCKHNCYDDCYAKNISKRYLFDFHTIVKRKFEIENDQLFIYDICNNKHETKLIKEIEKIDMPFVRIGEMGDPSYDWIHTIEVCKKIAKAKKKIVIITKHWKTIPENLYGSLKELDLCINTSVSALDSDKDRIHRLNQYDILKKYCNSVLRIVSCDFNLEHPEGLRISKIQEELFKNENTLDTIFRPSIDNKYLMENIIKVQKKKFIKSNVMASVYNEDTYMGDCKNCPDMCGIK